MIESNILISCFISISDDSFDFKSFTVDIILSSLKKIFRSLALIDIKVIDMTFIDESLMSELCEHFDIQSISLSKSKSIQSYDEIFDWKLITHALYTSIMIQEHKNEMMLLFNVLSRSAQDNHWKSLIEKKSNFGKFCKWSINIIVEDSNIEICCFKSKQSISILQIWIKQNLQNEMKELELNCYINDHLEETHESEISE